MVGKARNRKKITIGWREWAGLPDLGVASIKAKVDSGARTSAIHAFNIRPFVRDGQEYVRFCLHPVQHRRRPEVQCEARLLEERMITSSSGVAEKRYVIRTRLTLDGKTRRIELTLANRDQLGFRMLIGREAVRDRYLIDPGSSYRLGEPTAEKSQSGKKATGK